jgi:hypothetical protein
MSCSNMFFTLKPLRLRTLCIASNHGMGMIEVARVQTAPSSCDHRYIARARLLSNIQKEAHRPRTQSA